MQVALLSDVHSNLPALEAVLGHLGLGGRYAGGCVCGGEARADELWCLGDTVGYNAHPAECLALVRKHCSTILLGNHDWAAVTGDVRVFNANAAAGVEHARAKLSDKDIEFLRGLKPEHRRPDALLVHGSPDDPLWEYLDAASARRFMDRADIPPFLAFGHTHVPFVLRGPRVVMNAGSVGQPRDGDPRACFFTVDVTTGATLMHRVPYDIDAAANAVREAGLPRILGDRLYLGR